MCSGLPAGTVRRDGQVYHQEYERGVPKTDGDGQRDHKGHPRRDEDGGHRATMRDIRPTRRGGLGRRVFRLA